ncbi:MAG: MarR family transcriptional regulator [Oceanospirillaceae bacterium]
MSQPKLSTIDQRLCFALYSSSQAIIKKYRPFLQELGMTYPQYLVFLVLVEQGELTVKELGGYLDLDSGTLTPLLKRMEQQQRVIRKRSAHDERKVNVKLTDQAKELIPLVAQMQSCVATATHLDESAFNDLLLKLQQLKKNLLD